jgi:class 3 adenylate cyclase
MGRHVKNFSIKSTGATALGVPDATTDQRPEGQDGQIVFNSTTQTFQGYIGNSWVNISTGGTGASGEKTLIIDKFQGDGSTVAFGNGSGNTLDGSTAATLSVTPGDATDMAIFIGGVYQVPGTNYTYSAGTITFGSAPPANNGSDSAHIIAIIHNLHKLGN